jgi:hypothetical protein
MTLLSLYSIIKERTQVIAFTLIKKFNDLIFGFDNFLPLLAFGKH